MRKYFYILLIIGLMLSSCSHKKEKDKQIVNFYNWGDYIDPQIIKIFKEETGIEVRMDTFPTSEMLYTKIISEPDFYDVAVPSEYMVRRMIREKLLAPITEKKVPNKKYIMPIFKKANYDETNSYSLPYLWGSLGIIYDSKTVKEPVNIKTLWDKKYQQKIFMFDSLRETIAMSFLYTHPESSFNTTDETILKRGIEALKEQKPLVSAYVDDENYRDLLALGEADISMGWSGDIRNLQAKRPTLKYALPDAHHVNLWVDCIVIPKKAPHLKNAYKWVNFLNRPDIAKKISDFTGYPTPNQKTYEELPEEIKSDKSMYPDQEDPTIHYEFFTDLGKENIQLYSRYWTEFKGD